MLLGLVRSGAETAAAGSGFGLPVEPAGALLGPRRVRLVTRDRYQSCLPAAILLLAGAAPRPYPSDQQPTRGQTSPSQMRLRRS